MWQVKEPINVARYDVEAWIAIANEAQVRVGSVAFELSCRPAEAFPLSPVEIGHILRKRVGFVA